MAAQFLDRPKNAIAKQLELWLLFARYVGPSEQPIPHLAGPVYGADVNIGVVKDIGIVAHELTGQRSDVRLIEGRQGQETQGIQSCRVLVESCADALPPRFIEIAFDRVLKELPQALNDA